MHAETDVNVSIIIGIVIISNRSDSYIYFYFGRNVEFFILFFFQNTLSSYQELNVNFTEERNTIQFYRWKFQSLEHKQTDNRNDTQRQKILRNSNQPQNLEHDLVWFVAYVPLYISRLCAIRITIFLQYLKTILRTNPTA